MLDFVARPQPAPFPIGRQRRLLFPAIQLALLCALLPGVTGCRNAAQTSAPTRAEVRQERRAEQSKMDTARQELEQIPPPSKNRYLSVRTREAYGNPFLVVHPQTVTLNILYRDQDPNGFNGGGLLRPVAIEESPTAPKTERVAIRRNVEATIQILNDLGVVVDEWTGSNGALLR